MTKEKAQEIASFLAGKSHRMSGREANEFFQIYKTYVNPKAKTQPCSCNPNEWKRMMEETLAVVDQALATTNISLVVYELPGDTQSQSVNDTIDEPTDDSQVSQDTPKPKRKAKQLPNE
jgi:hypothetical protein